MNCPKCGTLNSSESKFCIKCGQSLSMEPQQFPETTTQVIPNQSVNNTQIQDGSTFQNININTNLQPVNDVTNNGNEFNISNNSNNISSGNLNLDNNTWKHPCTGEEFNYSFFDLYDMALVKTVKIINEVDKMLNDKKIDNKRIEKLFGNLDYGTGMDCDLEMEYKYFKY